MVQKTANHSWNTLEKPLAPPLPDNFVDLEPLDQLAVLGFDTATVDKMVAIQHEDWCRFYRAGGGTHRSALTITGATKNSNHGLN